MKTYGIDRRVWGQIIGEREATPALVAFAASACPEVLDEILDELGRVREDLNEWSPLPSLHLTEQSTLAIECHDRFASVVIRNALASWTMSSNDAAVAISALARWDYRLAMWCACAVAETTLNLVPAGENRPRVAIEAARSWVLGRGAIDDVRRLAGDADIAASRLSYAGDQAASNAASAAARAANEVYFAAYDASAAHAFAYADSFFIRYGTPRHTAAREDELKRLREVVAEAIINYPTGEMVGPSRGISRGTLAAGIAGIALGAGAIRLARRA